MTVRLKVGQEHIGYLQHYNNMAAIVSAIFPPSGGSGGGSASGDFRPEDVPQTAEEATMRFAALFS